MSDLETALKKAVSALERASVGSVVGGSVACYKAWCDNVLVDLMYEPVGLAVDDTLLERSETLNVAGLRVEGWPWRT